MATGDHLTAAKAWAAGVFGLLAPGAAYIAGAAEDGITASEWLIAGCWVIIGGPVAGAVVYSVENKRKAGTAPRPAPDPRMPPPGAF